MSVPKGAMDVTQLLIGALTDEVPPPVDKDEKPVGDPSRVSWMVLRGFLMAQPGVWKKASAETIEALNITIFRARDLGDGFEYEVRAGDYYMRFKDVNGT